MNMETEVMHQKSCFSEKLIFHIFEASIRKKIQKNLLYKFRVSSSDCDGSNKSYSFRENWVGLSKSIKVWSFFCRVWTTKTLMTVVEKIFCQQNPLYNVKAMRPWWRSSDLQLRITTTLKFSWIRKLEIFH